MSGSKPVGLTQAENALWVAPLPDDKKPVDKNTKHCAACGRYHGGVQASILCLESAVRSMREEIAGLKTRLRLERAGREPASPSPPAPESAPTPPSPPPPQDPKR
jgi:hypothetical protein